MRQRDYFTICRLLLLWMVGSGLSIISSELYAQNESNLLLFEEELELLTPEEETYNWEEELEELTQRLQEPLNLNSATREELLQFPFLSEKQIENILAYIQLHGAMQTLYELALVEELDKQSINRLRPFVTVFPMKEKSGFPTWKQLVKYGRHEALARVDLPFYTRKGYETKTYLGPPFYHSLRYRFHYGDYLQAGLTAEKDAGEPFFAGQERQGYDYCSPYLLFHNWGKVKTLAVGNYRLGFGMGLVMSMDFRLGKTFSLSNFRSSGIRKHSSTDEYNYLRGVAVAIEPLAHLQLSTFYSHRTLDGTVKGDTLSSIAQSGLHRSQNEMNKQNSFTLQAAGGHLNYLGKWFQIGATGLYYAFNLPYEPRLTKYAKYNLHGKEFYNIGINYRLRSGDFTLSGEAAKGKQGFGLINLLDYTPSSAYHFRLIHRYYAHNYWAFFARSFGESSRPQNENGWYVAAEIAPLARWRFFGSLDLVSFPWWKYRVSKPSQAVDGMFQCSYSPSRDLTMYLNYRYKRKERDVTGSSGSVILPTNQHKIRYRLQYTSDAWLLGTTFDYTLFQQQTSAQGYQFTQLLGYTFPFGLATSAQGSYFHTDDYDSRVFIHERGLLYTFSTPSYYGEGFRYAICLRYDLNAYFMFQLKLGQTCYQNRSEIGSGNDMIRGHKKTDLQMQGRIKF